MPRMGVIGGGPIGLTTAMLAANRGWDVVVFERDAAPLPPSPEAAWLDWDRSAVSQFRMAHTILPLGASILREHLPEVLRAMFDAGGVPWTSYDFLPPGIIERDDEERFTSVGARRPIYEYAFATGAAAHPGVDVRRGVKVESLIPSEPVRDPVHLAGVVANGVPERFDVLIDAGGRRSRVPELIVEAGGSEPAVQAEDSRFTYYGRHYRSTKGVPRPFVPDLKVLGSIGVLLIPGDNDTWSMTIYSATSDRALRAVRDDAVFDRVVTAVPSIAAWADAEPITDVAVMSGVLDRQRDFVVGGVPIATGVVPVGDAWACTNPSQGRGISFGLLHALRTVDAVDANRDDPMAQSLAWHEATMRDVEPWHAATLASDRRLVASFAAAAAGEPPPEPTGTGVQFAKALAATQHDPKIFRWLMEYFGCFVLPQDVFARPGVMDHIDAVLERHPPPPPPEPELSRDRLEALLTV